jgi:hypothetical protein
LTLLGVAGLVALVFVLERIVKRRRRTQDDHESGK